LTAQARRSEFGVLRALGLSSTRVVFSLIFEQVFVVIIGGIVGSFLGFILSVFVVPTLALGTTGEGVVPPFITKTEWAAIGNFWLIMLGVLLVVFATAFWLVRQLSLTRSLRLGDE
jgi:ABC-type antimicrobial peptide transport system permease subunit